MFRAINILQLHSGRGGIIIQENVTFVVRNRSYVALQSVYEKWFCHLLDTIYSQVIGITALALGLISVGTCNNEVTSALLQSLIERSESELRESHAKFIALALALVYLGTFLIVLCSFQTT